MRSEDSPKYYPAFAFSVGKPRKNPTRHGGRYEYTALEADSSVHERLELERKARERAQNACQHYLRSCPRYTLLHHLNDIGSRVDKHWFVVRDTSVKTERLLTLVPLSSNCAIECNPSTRGTILELFLALQHPYIYPVLDLDFRDVSGQTYVILVLPFNNKGSLKDLIYKSRWQDDWSQKYGQRSAGLPISQCAVSSTQKFLVQQHITTSKHQANKQLNSKQRQLFLTQPTTSNVRSEFNIDLCRSLISADIPLYKRKNKVFREFLEKYTQHTIPDESTLRKTYAPSIYDETIQKIRDEIKDSSIWVSIDETPDKEGDDICHICRCTNYNLFAVVEVLEFIFQNPERRFPSVEELLMCDFFRNIDLREMRATPLPETRSAKTNNDQFEDDRKIGRNMLTSYVNNS
ncbi:hypothetical protein ANN_16534 [Periplaneta americana]|uniref:Uncharacterized protein n=1 Tax=Periplaneta americana TaxID=6978 RepID=A0ABQ8SRE7_PERAM|nr:hypothetical protein ANN_16534 [Periplaneta americana]